MEQYNCLIVDDEHPALALLEAYIAKLPYLNLVASCENGVEALSALQQHDIKILFLDIQMPEITGIQLLESLSKKPQVILTTAYRDFAVKGYELDVTDYLIKPFSFERFLHAVDKAVEKTKLLSKVDDVEGSKQIESQKEDHFFVKSNGKFEKVIYADILYLESMREYVSIHTKDRRYLVNFSLTSAESKLPTDLFMRVHRSHIVGLNHITSITGNMIQVPNKTITIGRSYREAFFERLNLL